MHILYNAKVITLDDHHPLAEAVAIQDGSIIAVGDNQSILETCTYSDLREDMSGQTILPGLTDAHIHLLQYAQSLSKIDCEVPTKEECINRVREKISGLSNQGWLLGHGWDQNRWNGNFPTVADLDAISTRVPIYLTSRSLHSAWANSAAMRLAGIDQNTPDPPGGRISRDEHGNPDGILFDNAVLLIENCIPLPSIPEAASSLVDAITHLHKFGITSVHDFDDPICYDALRSLHDLNNLTMRVSKNMPFTKWKKPLGDLPISGSGDDLLRFGSLKLFADGALGSRTAAMMAPYEDSNELGLLVNDRDQIFDIGRQAVDHGISLAIHAIGDRANHEVLEAICLLRQYEVDHHLQHLRHRIEHVQLLLPDDLHLFQSLDLTASIQPVHAISDQKMALKAWASRTVYSYLIRDLIKAGIQIVFGTDAPVENPNPFHTLHAAVTRNLPGKSAKDSFYPDQSISILDSFYAICRNPQQIIGQGNKLGCLKKGYFADLVLLPWDPFAIDLDNLYNIKVSATMIVGKWVWQS